MKNLNFVIILSILITVGCSSSDKQSEDEKLPNVVIIYADDMGFGDVALNNPDSKLKTPNLDKLAMEGVNFTDAHTSSAVCTPSRYSLMTGRYPWRSSKKRGVLNGYGKPLVEIGRQTLGSIFKKAGYNTAIIGKWHLGVEWQTKEPGQEPGFGTVDYTKPVKHTPTQLGFDYSYIFSASLDFSPAIYIENNKAAGPVNSVVEFHDFPAYSRKSETTEGFRHVDVLDHLKDKAVKYINENAGSDKPFFLYFPLTAPHKPLIPHPRFRGTSEAAWYGDFVQQVDWTVGEVLNTLDKKGLKDNTLVIYSSDNGSYMYKLKDDETDHMDDLTIQGFRPENHKANWNWRGTKADIYEAGHRVPFMIRWPDKIKPAQCNTTICLSDVSATLVDLLSLEADPSQMEDSYSFGPLLKGETTFNRKPVVHQSSRGALAIRKGKYKLILCSGSGGREVPAGKAFEQPYQLYDMAADPWEINNIYSENEAIGLEMEKELFDIIGDDLTEKDIRQLRR